MFSEKTIKQLIVLADSLDQKGLKQEADTIDKIVKEAEQLRLEALVEIIPVSDGNNFEDDDKALGYNNALYFDKFIIVTKEDAAHYRKFVEEFESRQIS